MLHAAIRSICEFLEQSQHFVATFSGRKSEREVRTTSTTQKVVLKTVSLKEEDVYQVNIYTQKQHFTTNQQAIKETLPELLTQILEEPFTQVHVQTPAGDMYWRVVKTQEGMRIKKKSTVASIQEWEHGQHNEKRNYLVTPENSAAVLHALGICSARGELYGSMSAKYRQINHFIGIASKLDILKKDEISIVDCGCGKAYLSLTLYHYITTILGKKCTLVGIDSNAVVISFCTTVAQNLEFNSATFECASISQYKPEQAIDVVIALHACDTATDDALALAVQVGAESILAAPCCHHYVNDKLRLGTAPSEVALLLRDGITRERFADLLTDSMRRDILKAKGYSAELIEFVAPEHTTKNIMIRAEKSHSLYSHNTLQPDAFAKERKTWNVAPKLAELLKM